MATTTIELPPDVQRELEALARRTGRTEAEVIIEAVERHLQAEQRPRPKSFGIAEDPELSGTDSEDWLKANWRPEDDWRSE